MSIVKKWAYCVITFIAGVLGLALSATTGMKVVTTIDGSAIGQTIDGSSKIVKAFKVLTDSDLMEQAKALDIKSEFVTMKVFAIITLVLSILLIVYAVIALLQNLNVIKSNHIAFDIVAITLVVLFLVATIGLLVSSNAYAGALEKATETIIIPLKLSATELAPYISVLKWNATASVGVYQPFMLVVSIITAIVTGTFTILNRKRG